MRPEIAPQEWIQCCLQVDPHLTHVHTFSSVDTCTSEHVRDQHHARDKEHNRRALGNRFGAMEFIIWHAENVTHQIPDGGIGSDDRQRKNVRSDGLHEMVFLNSETIVLLDLRCRTPFKNDGKLDKMN